MNDLKTGDVISNGLILEQVLARLEDIVFTRNMLPNGAVGPLNKPQLIEDLIVHGFTVKL